MKSISSNKIICFLLISVLMFSTFTVNAFAFDNSINAQPSILKKVDKKSIEVVSKELALLDNVGFDANNIMALNKNSDGSFTYTYKLAGNIIGEATLIEEALDFITIEFVEGECHDALTIFDDGTLYLDGNKIIFSEIETNRDYLTDEQLKYFELIQNETSFSYYTSPPFGTKSSDYTLEVTTHKSPNNSIGKAIQAISVAALAVIIGAALKIKLPGSINTTILSIIASSLKSKAENVNPNSAFFSYKMKETQAPAFKTTWETFIKYSGQFYTEKDYGGGETSSTMYCYKTLL